MMENGDRKKQIKARLSRIEGQLRGVRNMLDEERTCREVMQQMMSIKAAVQQASVQIMRDHADNCMNDGLWDDKASRAAMLDDLIDLVGKNG